MKRNILLSGILISGLVLLSGCGNEITTESEVNTFNPDDFIGSWVSERPTLNVTKEGTNTYNFNVNWGASAEEDYEWNYFCNFNEQKEIMECTGQKLDVVCEGDDNCSSEIVSENQDAEFALKDGTITWNEKVDNSAENIHFTKNE